MQNIWEYRDLPIGTLQDCRLIMRAERESAADERHEATQDLLAAEMDRNDAGG